MPLNHEANQLAFRGRVLALVVCTTGSVTLAATTTGFTRSTGSFITDGFVPGQEITPAGFATNTPRVIKSVTALAIAVDGTLTAEDADAGRSLSVLLPTKRAWDNISTKPSPVEPFVEEEYLPATNRLLGIGPYADVEDTGRYLIRCYGVLNTGMLAVSRYAQAVLDAFPPGDAVALSTGTVTRVRGDVGPTRSELNRPGTQPVVTVSIPWRAITANSR